MARQPAAGRKLLEMAATRSLLPRARKVRRHHSEHLQAELLGDFAIFTWDAWIHDQVNYAEEDLFLTLGEDSLRSEHKVNYLSRKDVRLGFGRQLAARLVKKRRFQLKVSTTAHFMPQVVLISEHEARHQLTWANLDWDAIRRDIRWKHRLDWDRDVESVLTVWRSEAAPGLPAEECLYPGLSDHALLIGKVRRAQLALLHKTDRRLLKTLFTINLEPQEALETLAELKLATEAFEPSFRLQRTLQETDTVQLRARWEIDAATWKRVEKELVKPAGLTWEEAQVVIRLFDVTGEPIEVRPEERRPVIHADNWYFGQVEPGRNYRAALVAQEKETGKLLGPVILSEVVRIPPRPEKVVLMPVDDWRLFAYWHLEPDARRRVAERRQDPAWEGAPTYLRLFHDFGDALHHQMGCDVGFDPAATDNWYLNVGPDRVWHAQVSAVREGQVEDLTPVSNHAQTGRLGPGNNPVSYRSLSGPIEHPTVRRLDSKMNTADYSWGKLILHLHAHLPFIERRINYGTTGYWEPAGYPEEWYHEALRETYIPLVIMMDRLLEEGVDFKLSLDLSPPLIAMMQSPLLQEEFFQYIEGMVSLARAEVERTKRQAPHYTHTAWMHLDTFLRCKEAFLSYGCDLTRAFKKFQDLGKLEISTCAATHALLPFWTMYPEAVRGQVAVAVQDYERVFGRRPNGIWLPECAYVPGIEKFLEEQGVRYFFSEARTVLDADSRVEFGAHAPVFVRGSNVAVFPRDPETGKQVWSGEEGYPGDPDYLEFHIRGGPLKYNRITDRRGGWKQPYNREWALNKAASHAQHFLESRNFRFGYIRQWFWKKPLVSAPYDAELFGHHWYEGIDFIYFLLKKLYHDQNQTELTTPSHYLAEYPTNQEVWPCVSSWGDKSTFDKWMYGSVTWMYRHGHEAVEEMVRMASHARDQGVSEMGGRVLAQAARELLLAQNSDVAFVISNGHFVDRMKEMFFTSLENFWRLSTMYWELSAGRDPDEIDLRNMEVGSPVFPEIDPLIFAL
jgi:predicted glycosyl hydrolase (DUF1957 family)